MYTHNTRNADIHMWHDMISGNLENDCCIADLFFFLPPSLELSIKSPTPKTNREEKYYQLNGRSHQKPRNLPNVIVTSDYCFQSKAKGKWGKKIQVGRVVKGKFRYAIIFSGGTLSLTKEGCSIAFCRVVGSNNFLV